MIGRLALAACLAFPITTSADEPVDLATIGRIRDEAFHRSQVMETAAYLCDVIGPRLTNSPAARRANQWTRERFEAWGLSNAHLESFGPVGLGWSFDHVAVHLVSPVMAPLLALPQAWNPGTNGPLRAKAVKIKLRSEEDLTAAKGKVEGKIVLIDDAREVKGEDKPALTRLSEKDLLDMGQFEIPAQRKIEEERAAEKKRRGFRGKLNQFLSDEKALAAIQPSREDGVVRVEGGYTMKPEDPKGVPALVMLTEHYNRLVRLLDRGLDVELEIDVSARFHDDDLMGYNTVADIPGTDKKAEIVMAGAHVDSWHSGTGATDNGAGVAVVMEAARILKVLGVKPRRTIRFALWTGEEEWKPSGSESYVRQHFAERAPSEDPEDKDLDLDLQKKPGRLTLKPDHALLSAYFNLDNGTGKIRGVYIQDNDEVRPIFESWIAPLKDFGVTTLTIRNTGSTDHMSFDAVGLPAFQFIQDPLEYGTRTHHSNMDVYDHLVPGDLQQSSAVLAWFVYNSANRPEMLPRKPMPKPGAGRGFGGGRGQ
jgi:carboxypeptidase Q